MSLLKKVSSGTKLSSNETLELYKIPLFELASVAHDLRMKYNDPSTVTYLIDRNINYSNICNVGCAFCGFYRTRRQTDSYVLSYKEISRKISELEMVGGTRILMQGGVNPYLPFSWYLELLKHIKAKHPKIRIEAFSPEEIRGMSKLTGMTSIEVLKELQAAGLDGLPGGGGEILVDRIRKAKYVAPARISTNDWLNIMGEAQSLGLYTSATMVIGFGETFEERVEHFRLIHDLQEKSLAAYGNAFSAFISWTLQTKGVRIDGRVPSAGSHEYLQNLAISRIYLNNIPNYQASWPTMGFKVAQSALFFGANDFGSTMLEENVVSKAGAKNSSITEQEIIRQIYDAGFKPKQRDSLYNIIYEPNVNGILTKHSLTDFERVTS